MWTLKAVFLCIIAIFEVTANPLLQALPTQTCQVCPQGGRNQYTALPYILQQSPGIAPYLQSLLGQNPVSTCHPNNPCLKPNPCSGCQNQNNQMNSNLFNKILSNPTLKTILDPNTRMFNQNGCEIPRNGPCGNNVPNVVNNYIIVPPEFLLEDKSCKEDKRDARARGHRPVDGKKRQKVDSGERTKAVNENRKERDRDENVQLKDSVDETNRDDKERPRRRKVKNPNFKLKIVNENVTVSNQTETHNIQKEIEEFKQDHNNIDITTEITKLEETTTASPADFKETGKEQDPKGNNLQQEPKVQAKPTQKEFRQLIEERNQPARVQVTEAKENTEKTKVRNGNGQVSNKKSRVRVKANTNPIKNDREEAAIQDFRLKFPNIPEEVVRNLLDHMKKQLEKQQLGVPAFYFPQYPLSYEQLYKPQGNQPSSNQSSKSNVQNKPKSGKRKNRRRNRIQNRKPQNINTEDCNTVIELTPTVIKEELTTTESQPDVETTTKSTEITKPTDVPSAFDAIETTTIKNDKEASPIEQNDKKYDETMTDYDTEDVVPTYYYPDYYPEFANDNKYLDEDYSVKYLQDDRYHYTTDKNYEFEELNRERRKYDPKFMNENDFKRFDNKFVFRLHNKEPRQRNRLTRPRIIESTTERPRFTISVINEEVTTIKPANVNPERETIKKFKDLEVKTEAIEFTTAKEPIVEFRTPPTLDAVDFETKPINREKFYSYSDFADKLSSYSDAKTPRYIVKDKGDKIKAKIKPKDEIETVFARSKVVTYGRQNSEENEDLIKHDDDISEYVADDKTVVLAKSVDTFW